MTRAFNFSAGPATLPESVLRQAQAEMLEWNGVGASIVEISQAANGSFVGHITEILQSDKGPNPVCDKCKDDRKNKPVKGMEIIRGMKKDGAAYAGGTILRPADGKVFKSKMQLIEGGKKLEVSGCVAFICKEQIWVRQ